MGSDGTTGRLSENLSELSPRTLRLGVYTVALPTRAQVAFFRGETRSTCASGVRILRRGGGLREQEVAGSNPVAPISEVLGCRCSVLGVRYSTAGQVSDL